MKRLSFLAATLLAASLGAQAQAFPSKAVNIVVPFPPGGGADALTRIMQPALGKLWGQSIIVENKPGAAGLIGAEYVAKAPPDGHTLIMSSTGGITARNLHEFAAVTLVSASPYVVVVNPKVPVASIRELVDYAKKNPGKVSFGSSGTGAASHLSAELFKSMAGVDMLHVPYKGTGQAVTDLIGGQIDVMFAPAQAVMPHVQGGKLKALAVTSPKRFDALPDLPTVAESGVPGYEAIGWFGLFVPAATPKERVAKISADANKVLADPEVKQKMLSMGAEPAGGTPERFAKFVADEMAKWTLLMKERGITPE